MAAVDKYTALITAEHANKPKFVAMVQAVAGALSDAQTFAASINEAFDPDTAVGVQLDDIGQWIGFSRNINVPLSVYFSLDTAGFGFDQGSWQGPFDPSQGLTSLDNETYRAMLRIKIGANHWDGTMPSFISIMSGIFAGSSTTLFAVDNQDMSMSAYIVGAPPAVIFTALLKNGFSFLKPAGVSISYQKPSVDNSPLFGFDLSNTSISGFDTGSWSVPI